MVVAKTQRDAAWKRLPPTISSRRSTRLNPPQAAYARSMKIKGNCEPMKLFESKKLIDGSSNSVPLSSGLRRSSRLSCGSCENVEMSSNVAHKSINSATLGNGSSLKPSTRLPFPLKACEFVCTTGSSRPSLQAKSRKSSRLSLQPNTCESVGNRGETLNLRQSLPPKTCESVGSKEEFLTLRRSSRLSLPLKPSKSVGNPVEFSTLRGSRLSLPPKTCEFVSNTGEFSTFRRSSRLSLPPKTCELVSNVEESSSLRRSRLSLPPKTCEFVSNREEFSTHKRSSRLSLPPETCEFVSNVGEFSTVRQSRLSLSPKPCESVSNREELSTHRRSSRLSLPQKTCEFVSLSSNAAPKAIISKELKKLVQCTFDKSDSTGVASDRRNVEVVRESTGNGMQKSTDISVVTTFKVNETEKGDDDRERNEGVRTTKKRKPDEEGDDSVQGQEWTKGGSLTLRRSSRLSLPLKACEFISPSSNAVPKKVIVQCTLDKSMMRTGVVSDKENAEVGVESTGNVVQKNRNASVATFEVSETDKGEDACKRNEGVCVNKKRKPDKEGDDRVQGQDWTKAGSLTLRRSSRLSILLKTCEFISPSCNAASQKCTLNKSMARTGVVTDIENVEVVGESTGNGMQKSTRNASVATFKVNETEKGEDDCERNEGVGVTEKRKPDEKDDSVQGQECTRGGSLTLRRSSRLSLPLKTLEFISPSNNVLSKKVIVAKELKKLVQCTFNSTTSTGVVSDRENVEVGGESTRNVMRKSRNADAVTFKMNETEKGVDACERNEGVCVTEKEKRDKEGDDRVQGQDWTKAGSLTLRRSSRLSFPLKTCEFSSRSSDAVSKKVVFSKELKVLVQCAFDKSMKRTGVASDQENVELDGESTEKREDENVVTFKGNETEKGEDACERNEGICVDNRRKPEEEGDDGVQGSELTRRGSLPLRRSSRLSFPPSTCEFVSNAAASKKAIITKESKKLVQCTFNKSTSTGIVSDIKNAEMGGESTGNVVQKSRNIASVSEADKGVCVTKKRKPDEEGDHDRVHVQDWTKVKSLTLRRSSRLSLPLKSSEFIGQSSSAVSKKVIVIKELKKLVECTSDKSVRTKILSDRANVGVGGMQKSMNASDCERIVGVRVNKKRKPDE